MSVGQPRSPSRIRTYFLLSLQLGLQVLDKGRFEVFHAVQLKPLQLTLDSSGNAVEFLLTAIHLGVPLMV